MSQRHPHAGGKTYATVAKANHRHGCPCCGHHLSPAQERRARRATERRVFARELAEQDR